MESAHFSREQALHAAWESTHERVDWPWHEFAAAMANWEVEPVVVDGRLVGAVLMYGPEIHACIKPEGFRRWLTKSVLERTLYTRWKKYGYATSGSNTAIGDKFLTRLGFTKEGSKWVSKPSS